MNYLYQQFLLLLSPCFVIHTAHSVLSRNPSITIPFSLVLTRGQFYYWNILTA